MHLADFESSPLFIHAENEAFGELDVTPDVGPDGAIEYKGRLVESIYYFGEVTDEEILFYLKDGGMLKVGADEFFELKLVHFTREVIRIL